MRKLFLLFAALCGLVAVQAQEIDAVKVTQGSTTDWYLFDNSNRLNVPITNGNPIFNGKTYDLAEGKVSTTFGTAPADEWVTLRTDVTPDNWNTICMENNITDIDGATFWNVVAERTNEFELEQVFEPQAGYGYIIYYTATELKVKYGNETEDEPVSATKLHPIQGIYEAITTYDQEGKNALTGNYVVYNNELCKVTGWVTMADHRAYVVADKAPKQAPAPNGAPRMTMRKPNGTPTDINTLPYEGKAGKGSFKVLKNGQFRIIRDGKAYNAQGIEL